MSQTDEQYIKLKAHEYYMRFKNLGLTHERAQDATHLLILALCDQYLKINKDTPEDQQKAMQRFEQLAKGLNDYFHGRDYVEVNIKEIAALKGCHKNPNYNRLLMKYKSFLTAVENLKTGKDKLHNGHSKVGLCAFIEMPIVVPLRSLTM
jgi:hypothetical protein